MNTTITSEFRAGGTDLYARLRRGLVHTAITEVPQTGAIHQIQWNSDGSATVGALVTIATLAQDARVKQAYATLSFAAGGLATPQIRTVATLGGNLLQRTRCHYYRHPGINCYKTGGSDCPAHHGINPNGVIFDLSACVYPHPSTLAVALLAYEAEVAIEGQGRRAVSSLYGDGSDPSRDHLLAATDLLTHVHLPTPMAERGAYFRAIRRAEAEWPLVECVVRLGLENDSIKWAKVAVGGVATIPLRLPGVENALIGEPATADTFARASTFASEGATPSPQTVYKVKLLQATVLETLERALRL